MKYLLTLSLIFSFCLVSFAQDQQPPPKKRPASMDMNDVVTPSKSPTPDKPDKLEVKTEVKPDPGNKSASVENLRNLANLDYKSSLDLYRYVFKTDNQFIKPQILTFSTVPTKDKLGVFFALSLNNQISTTVVYLDKDLLAKIDKILEKAIKERGNSPTDENIFKDLLGEKLVVYGDAKYNAVLITLGIIDIVLPSFEARALQKVMYQERTNQK